MFKKIIKKFKYSRDLKKVEIVMKERVQLELDVINTIPDGTLGFYSGKKQKQYNQDEIDIILKMYKVLNYFIRTDYYSILKCNNNFDKIYLYKKYDEIALFNYCLTIKLLSTPEYLQYHSIFEDIFKCFNVGSVNSSIDEPINYITHRKYLYTKILKNFPDLINEEMFYTRMFILDTPFLTKNITDSELKDYYFLYTSKNPIELHNIIIDFHTYTNVKLDYLKNII